MRLVEALERVQALAIPAAAKAQLEAMLRAASNPEAERPEVVLRTLERERQANAAETERAVGSLFLGLAGRGRAALAQMSDAQWQALLDDEEG